MMLQRAAGCAAASPVRTQSTDRRQFERRRGGVDADIKPEDIELEPLVDGEQSSAFTWPARVLTNGQGEDYPARSQAGPGNDINAGSPGSQKAPAQSPASLVSYWKSPAAVGQATPSLRDGLPGSPPVLTVSVRLLGHFVDRQRLASPGVATIGSGLAERERWFIGRWWDDEDREACAPRLARGRRRGVALPPGAVRFHGRTHRPATTSLAHAALCEHLQPRRALLRGSAA